VIGTLKGFARICWINSSYRFIYFHLKKRKVWINDQDFDVLTQKTKTKKRKKRENTWAVLAWGESNPRESLWEFSESEPSSYSL